MHIPLFLQAVAIILIGGSLLTHKLLDHHEPDLSILRTNTVKILAQNGENKENKGGGTGFFIDERHVVTNYHVACVEDRPPVRVFASTGGLSWGVESVRCDEAGAALDIALITVPWPNHDIQEVEIRSAKLDEPTWSLGLGGGHWSYKVGRVAATNIQLFEDELPYIGTSFGGNLGDSGSPVIGPDGQLIGVVAAIYTQQIPVMWGTKTVPLNNLTFARDGGEVAEWLSDEADL